MIISAVLRQSLAFGPEHVEWLGRQVERVYPNAKFLPFSDVALSIPHERLAESLPSWWAKMEAYKRLTSGTVMMLDLDCVLLKDFDPPTPEAGMAYMQVSARNSDLVWGGLSISSPEFRRAVTDHFYVDPQERIKAVAGCDQRYYSRNWRKYIKTLNMARPDACVSYKMHYLQQGLQPNNAVVMFHGLPRPWHVIEDWIPPLLLTTQQEI